MKNKILIVTLLFSGFNAYGSIFDQIRTGFQKAIAAKTGADKAQAVEKHEADLKKVNEDLKAREDQINESTKKAEEDLSKVKEKIASISKEIDETKKQPGIIKNIKLTALAAAKKAAEAALRLVESKLNTLKTAHAQIIDLQGNTTKLIAQHIEQHK